MNLKTWSIIGALFLASSSLWTGYILSRRAFLREFNGGVHAYLAGDFMEADKNLTLAIHRWPHNAQVKDLLIKVLIEQSFSLYHAKDIPGALSSLARVSQMTSPGDPAQPAIKALREQLSTPPEKRPVNMDQVLHNLYQHLPEQDQPESLPALMQLWFQRSQASQESMLKHFLENQNVWLGQLERQKDEFRKILYGGLALFGIGGVALLVLLVGVLHTYFGRRGVFSRLLEDHYQRLVAVLPAGSQVLLGPPVSLTSVPESRQLDIIEAEIVSGSSAEESHRRLELLLEGDNPWMRARAAKILYQLNPKLAIEELKRLVAEAATDSQVSGMWALSELATPEALELLAPLAYSKVREIQQGAIRSLLQLQSKENLPSHVHDKLSQVLTEIRSRTGWIF